MRGRAAAAGREGGREGVIAVVAVALLGTALFAVRPLSGLLTWPGVSGSQGSAGLGIVRVSWRVFLLVFCLELDFFFFFLTIVSIFTSVTPIAQPSDNFPAVTLKPAERMRGAQHIPAKAKLTQPFSFPKSSQPGSSCPEQRLLPLGPGTPRQLQTRPGPSTRLSSGTTLCAVRAEMSLPLLHLVLGQGVSSVPRPEPRFLPHLKGLC